jgi:hypothetical protein
LKDENKTKLEVQEIQKKSKDAYNTLKEEFLKEKKQSKIFLIFFL